MSAVLPSSDAAISGAPPQAAPSERLDRAFLGHPAGLGWLAFCEFWERFSYYGMQALLVLYLSNYLFKPEHIAGVAGMDTLRAWIEAVTGPRTPQQLASLVFGLYAGLVYLTPLIGGYVADRWIGRTRAVTAGALLMALGHFLMAFDASFLPALACLLVGVGAFKGNIAAQVGALYQPGDKRRATAFQIFMLAVQIAVIVSPIVCGTLGERVAWHWGFGAAGVGMVIGLFVYLAGRRYLPPEAPRAQAQQARPAEPMSRRDKRRLALLVAMIPVLTLSLVGNQQFNNGYPLWAQAHMDMTLWGWAVPVTWLQAGDAAISLMTMLLSLAFWRWCAQRGREPDELSKMALGTLIACSAPAVTVLAASMVEHGERIGLGWSLTYNLLNNLGFANVLPVGLALYSRAAPQRLAGLVIGAFYLHLFFGNTLVGWLAGLLSVIRGTQFWALHAGLVGAAAVLLLLIKLAFGKLLDDEHAKAAAA